MTDALERLIEAVEAGAFSNPGGPNRFNAFADAWEGAFGAYSQPDYSRAWRAYGHHDDMTAALSLLSALLPDHDWGRAPGGQMWVHRPPAAPVWSGDGYPPARGLLLAILRAKLAENHPRQETSV